jgi:hypothetical protein
MNCESARDSIILAAYGELPDEQAVGLEQHLMSCEDCLAELETLRQVNQAMALHPVVEPDPNLMAQSRMRLDEALDAIPQHGFLMRVRADAMAWIGHLKGAPALATLLLGIGFLSGNFTHRWQDARAPKTPPVVILSKTGGGVSTISGISELPNDMVRVSYNRVVQEEAEGSLDDPQIRRLLMVGTNAADTNGVRSKSVEVLANECQIRHQCTIEEDGSGIRGALLASLRSDRNPGVRSKALDGLQPYVAQDERVRDAVSQVLMTDPSSMVRTKAFNVLKPVLSDTSVRQALQTVSTTDDNPYIRTVSTEALRSSSSLQ